MIAALFVEKDGPYSKLPSIELWHSEKDACLYNGPFPVIAHPPCERWGRYWSGGPSAKTKRKLGDDGGCFKSALKSVRKFGGVLEHPEASHAFRKYKLPRPAWKGGWSKPDKQGGRSCCVSQGHYGHKARKMTWLYAVGIDFPELIWGPSKNKMRMDVGFHSVEERRRAIKTGVCQRLSRRQRLLTPLPFRDLLIQMVITVKTKFPSEISDSKRSKRAKERRSMKLEMECKILAGAESKAFLADFSKLLDRAEGLLGKTTKTTPVIETETDDEEIETVTATKKTRGRPKKASAFGDDEDAETMSDDAAEETTLDEEDEDFAPKKTKGKKTVTFEDDDEETETETARETADEDEDEKPVKAARSKKPVKLTLDHVNDACLEKARRSNRAEVLSILKTKFKVKSVTDLDEDDYEAVIKAMKK